MFLSETPRESLAGICMDDDSDCGTEAKTALRTCKFVLIHMGLVISPTFLSLNTLCRFFVGLLLVAYLLPLQAECTALSFGCSSMRAGPSAAPPVREFGGVHGGWVRRFSVFRGSGHVPAGASDVCCSLWPTAPFWKMRRAFAEVKGGR